MWCGVLPGQNSRVALILILYVFHHLDRSIKRWYYVRFTMCGVWYIWYMVVRVKPLAVRPTMIIKTVFVHRRQSHHALPLSKK